MQMSTTNTNSTTPKAPAKKPQPKKLPPPGRKADFETAQAEVLKRHDNVFRRLAK